MIGRAGELGAALAGRAPSLSQARFPAYSTTMSLSPNAVLVLNLAAFGVDSVVRSVQVSVGGAGMPGNRGQVYALLHRFSAQAFLCDDLRTYPENFLGKPSRNFAVMAGENWQLVVYTGTLVPATGTLTLSADVIPGSPDNGPAVLTMEDMGQGRGTTRIIALGDPAAGVNYTTLVVPANVMWRARSGHGQLVTDATVITRDPYQLWDDGANVFGGGSVQDTGGQPASRTGDWIWGPLMPVSNGGNRTANYPTTDGVLYPGYRIVFNTANIAAADNWGPGFEQVEEWAGSP